MENTHPGKNPHGAGTVPAPQRVLFAMVGFFTIAFGQSRPSIRRIDLPESARKRHSDTNNPPPVRANHSGVYRGTKRLLPSATPPTNVLMACQMSLQIFPTGFGKKHPFTTAKIRPDSIPTEDYRFSLRSPWPAAYEPSRTVTRPATPLPWQLCPGFRRAL